MSLVEIGGSIGLWRAGAVALALWGLLPCASGAPAAQPFAALEPAGTVAGYVARLLINETPFPGEHGFVSTENTKAAMLAILWVLESRLAYIPPGYSQEQVAAVRTKNIVDVITAGGEKGQCDGFFRDASGRFTAVPRVGERIDYLLKIANSGGQPGRFADLLNYAQGLASTYVAQGMAGADRYAALREVRRIPVTGRAYGWMTDRDCYRPGGSFVAIPDADDGTLGGNRFFTLRRKP